MAAACIWGVESGKLMYPSTFGYIPTCVYMSYRPNESFILKQRKGKYTFMVYCLQKNESQEFGALDKQKVLYEN
jgi:hypothetical protein